MMARLCGAPSTKPALAQRVMASDRLRLDVTVGLYFQSLGVAIAKTTYATDASGEILALRQLLEAVELDGVRVQADALHANRPFSST